MVPVHTHSVQKLNEDGFKANDSNESRLLPLVITFSPVYPKKKIKLHITLKALLLFCFCCFYFFSRHYAATNDPSFGL